MKPYMVNNVEMQPPQEQQPTKKKFLIPLFMSLILIAIVLLILVLQKQSLLTPSASSTTVEEEEIASLPPVQKGAAEGVFSLSSGATQSATVGVPITFVLRADSNGRGVVGFDAILKYDVTTFKLGEIKSTLAGFTALGSDKKGYLEVTSFKELASAVAPILKDTEILTITLTPLKAGSFPIDLVDVVDSSNTKYVDTATEVYIPQVNGVTITVK